MPTLSFFYGIAIQMYWDDHPPPHFHARYAEYVATFGIEDVRRLTEQFPSCSREISFGLGA